MRKPEEITRATDKRCRTRRMGFRLQAAGAFCVLALTLTAARTFGQQTNFPAQPDPYIGLMMSQPRLETGAPPNPTANF